MKTRRKGRQQIKPRRNKTMLDSGFDTQDNSQFNSNFALDSSSILGNKSTLLDKDLFGESKEVGGILITTDLVNIDSSNNSYFANDFSLELDITGKAVEQVQNLLTGLEADAALTDKLEVAFGQSFKTEIADKLIDNFGKDNFSEIPEIKIVSGDKINGANGGYDSLNGLIYLSRDFVNTHQNDVNTITGVILEEVGHFIDSRINDVDTVGDEGELFSALVRGNTLSEENIIAIQTEDDIDTITIDGQAVEIEYSLPNSTELDFETLKTLLPNSLGNILTEDLFTEGDNGETIITWSNDVNLNELISVGKYLPELSLNNLSLTIPSEAEVTSYQLTAQVKIAEENYTIKGTLTDLAEIANSQLSWDNFAIENIDANALFSLVEDKIPSLDELIPDEVNRLGLVIKENSLQVTYNDNINLVNWIEDVPILDQLSSYLPDISLQSPTIKITENEGNNQYSLISDVTIGDDTVSLTGSFSNASLEQLTLQSFNDNISVDDWFGNIPLINDKFPTLSVNKPKLTINSGGDFTFGWGNTYNISQLFQDAISPLNLPTNITDNLLGNTEITNHQIAVLDNGKSINYSGNVNDNTLTATYTGNDFNLNYSLDDNLSIGDWFKDLPIINEIDISNPQISLTTSPYFNPVTGSYVNKGISFSGTILDFAKSENQYFNWMNNYLGVESLDISFAYDPSGNSSFTGRIATNIPIIDTDNFDATLLGASLDVSLNRGEPKFTIKGDLNVKLNDEDLMFAGGLSLEPESITAFYSLKADEDGWDNPFGLPDSEIRNLAFQLGITYQAPFIDNIGFLGDLQFGNFDVDTAVLVDTNDPDNFALVATPNEPLKLLDILLGPVASYAFSQTAENNSVVQNFREVLDDILDVQIEAYDIDGDSEIDPLFQIVPFSGVEIADIPLEEGLSLNAGLKAWGQNGNIYAKADRNNGVIEGSISLDKIDIGNGILVIEGNNDSQVNLDLMLSNTQQYLQGDASVKFLGKKLAGVDLKAGQNGLEFAYNSDFGIFSTNLDILIDDNGFAAKGDMKFDLDLEVSTGIGKVKLVDIGLDTKADLAFDGNSFKGIISGSFELWGKQISIPSLTIEVSDLENLHALVINKVEETIKNSANSIFGSIEAWVNAIGDGIIDFAGDAADFVATAISDFGASVNEITNALWNSNLVRGAGDLANVLWNNTTASVSNVAHAFKSQLGFATSTIANALSYGANLSINSITDALWDSAFIADSHELAGILWNNTTASVSNVAHAFKSQLGFATSTIANALSYGANLSINSITDALWDSAFIADSHELAGILWNNTTASVSNVAHAFKSQLGFATSTIANALSYGANLSINSITDALWDSAFIADSHELAGILWNNTTASVSNVAHAFKSQLGFATSTIANALSYGANLSINSITDALWDSAFIADSHELAGILWNNTTASVENIADAFRTELQLGADTIADALRYGANISVGTINDALGSAGDFFEDAWDGIRGIF